MHLKKILSIITASALMAGALSSCSMFDYLEKSNVTSAILKYLTAVQEADYNESSELVVDGQDAFFVNEMNDQEAELITAILSSSEFEIGDIEIDGESASAEVTVTLPDIESIADEGYSYEEFIEAIGTLDEKVDETLEYELNKSDEEWLIEGDSTEEYYNLLMDLIADLEFTNLTEENALELVETFMSEMSEGDLTSANGMLISNGSEFSSYMSAAVYIPGISDALTAYCDRLTYTSEVTEVTDEYIIVVVSGTAPDLQAAIDSVLDNEDVMVPIYADYIEATANGTEETLIFYSVVSSLMGAVCTELDTIQTAPVEFTFKVTEDENGELLLELTGGPEINIDFDSLTSRTDYIVPAITQLLTEGRITLDQVLELREMYGV